MIINRQYLPLVLLIALIGCSESSTKNDIVDYELQQDTQSRNLLF